jgi:RluA family pseudouridine synthase
MPAPTCPFGVARCAAGLRPGDQRRLIPSHATETHVSGSTWRAVRSRFRFHAAQDKADFTVVKGCPPKAAPCDADWVDCVARILFADDRLVAVTKPPGLSLATPQRAPTAAVARLLAALPASDVAGLGLNPETTLLVHRLDVGTSGLVLLARSAEAHRELSIAISNKLADKRYLALVWGHPRPVTGCWQQPLGPDLKDRRRMVVTSNGRPAASEYRTLGRAPHVSLLELHPLTGRTHQLRVHAANAGHLIVGDDLYGGPRHHGVRDRQLLQALQPDRPLLHAWRLTLPAGRLTDELRIEAPLPEDFAATLRAVDPSMAAKLAEVPWGA